MFLQWIKENKLKFGLIAGGGVAIIVTTIILIVVLNTNKVVDVESGVTTWEQLTEAQQNYLLEHDVTDTHTEQDVINEYNLYYDEDNIDDLLDSIQSAVDAGDVQRTYGDNWGKLTEAQQEYLINYNKEGSTMTIEDTMGWVNDMDDDYFENTMYGLFDNWTKLSEDEQNSLINAYVPAPYSTEQELIDYINDSDADFVEAMLNLV